MNDGMSREEEQKALAHAKRVNELCTTIATSSSKDERQAAARELGILSPPHILEETRLVVRCVRAPGGNFWLRVEGAHAPVLEMIVDESRLKTAMLSLTTLVAYPLLNDDEAGAKGLDA